MPNSGCINPMAPTVQCCVCHKRVKTCQADKYDVCSVPTHAQATKLPDGKWTCSHECYDTAMKPILTERGYGFGV